MDDLAPLGSGPDAPFTLPSDMAKTGGDAPSGGLGSGPDAPFELPSEAGKSPASTSSTSADVAKSTGQGLISGVEGMAGLPGDITNVVTRGAHAIASPVNYGMLWAEGWARQKAGALPAGETPSSWATKELAQTNSTLNQAEHVDDTSDVEARAQRVGIPNYQPQTTAGQYAKTVGSFVPGAVTMPGEGLAANVVKYAVVPGIMSETAGQLTKGTNAEPYARAVGALASGFGADIAATGASQAIKAGRAFAEPMTEAGQQAIAARKLSGVFHDPELSSAVLEESAAAAPPGASPGEIVPGSRPTTGQLTGDLGALSLERELATKQPELAKSNPFGTGSEQQNAARTSALNNIQPSGSPEAVGSLVRDQMARIQADEDAKVATATQQAQTSGSGATSALEGQASALDAAHTAGINDARQNAQTAAAGIGSDASPEAQGDALRTTLQSARDAAKANEHRLWNAVDPDGTLALPATPIAKAASEVTSSLPTTAKPMSGEENAIFQTAAHLPDVASFREITALRSRISSAMKEEMKSAGPTPTYARLTQLRGSVEDAITNAVENQAAHEAEAVASGQMSPDATMEANLRAEANAFQQNRAQSARASSGEGNTGYSGAGSSSISGSNRAEIPVTGGHGNPPGDQSVSLAPNLDEAAASRLRAASAATRQRAQTFDQGPVGTVLKTNGMAGNYKATDAAVPGKLFVKGPTGAQTVQSYVAAAGNSGIPHLETAAAESLRRSAMTPEGTIDPSKFNRWRTDHQDALRALPQGLRDRFQTAAGATDRLNELTTRREMAVEPLQGAAQSLSREVMTSDGVLDPRKFERWQAKYRDAIDQLPQSVRSQLSTASDASKAIAKAAEDRAQAIDTYQKSAAGKFLGVSAPEDVTKTVSRIFGTKTAVRDMSGLAKRVAGNPDAKEGLRKAVADTILAKAKGTTEAGASGVENLNASTFQKFLRENAATIKAAGFSDRELGSMQAIAQDMQRGQRTLQATRLAGQSNTAQDIIKAIEAGNGAQPSSLMNKIRSAGETGWIAHGPHGALGGAGLAIGEHVLAGMRNAGLAKANTLVRDAMLNPELARTLLQKASMLPNRGNERTLAKMLARNSVFSVNAGSLPYGQTAH